jgi:primosomal protein N' (replication factor Y)
MEETLKQDKQIILFLNRRGYSTFLSCRECGFVMKCRECGISMTYHKEEGNVRCHYCGRNESLPPGCPSCGSRYLRHFGSGTEKVEEQVNLYFPQIPAARLDLDSTKKKGSLDKILSDFRKGRTRILIGTQIVAKGLDFHHVGLVGILAADTTLNIPDYRSAERTFQLITQAAGRTGRGEARGRVVIQTYEPDHYAVTLGARQDYDGFYRVEKEIREGLKYPPFADILLLTVTGKKEKDSLEKAESVYKECMTAFGNSPEYTVFRPAAAVIAKQGNQYRHQIVMKVDRGRRKEYAVVLEKLKKTYGIIIDINPASMM